MPKRDERLRERERESNAKETQREELRDRNAKER